VSTSYERGRGGGALLRARRLLRPRAARGGGSRRPSGRSGGCNRVFVARGRVGVGGRGQRAAPPRVRRLLRLPHVDADAAARDVQHAAELPRERIADLGRDKKRNGS